MRLECFHIAIDQLSLPEAVARACGWLADEKPHYIVTPNPEMVMLAKRDQAFREALLKADLSLVDGAGLAAALRFLGWGHIPRVTGIDFLAAFFRAVPSGTKFFFLGGLRGVSQDAAVAARAQWGTTVSGTAEPPPGPYDHAAALRVLDRARHLAVMQAIRASRPDVLVVALGHGQQEKWLAMFLPECPTVRVAIGVGGALDYLAGRAERAPAMLRRLNLEWLWRLFREPRRAGRVWTATAAFAAETLGWWFSMRFRYRENVVGCIVNAKGDVLLVQRFDDPSHWQFPQGGRERGEAALVTLRREMQEELGLSKLTLLGQSRPDVYRYSWTQVHDKRQTLALQCQYGYRGQRQTVFYMRYAGADADIHADRREHTAWQWVPRDRLLEVLHPVRRALGRLVLQDLEHYG